ncbi:MAG: YggS family pyridoxal phosphate-dependent enzyme [Actinomycetes bacterium]
MTGSDDAAADVVDPRRDEVQARLSALRDRIAAAELACGRQPGEVTLVVVTKTWPASDVRILSELGVGDVGENRDQEASSKHAQCLDLPMRWHFIGRLQTNKCGSVARYADLVHSVDRTKLVAALARGVRLAQRDPLPVLVQVNLDTDGAAGSAEHADYSQRGGVAPGDARTLADLISSTQELRLAGVMGVAPLQGDPSTAFERLRTVSKELTDGYPSATIISAGMSGDYAAAISAGATHVRIGAAVLGHRAPYGVTSDTDGGSPRGRSDANAI